MKYDPVRFLVIQHFLRFQETLVFTEAPPQQLYDTKDRRFFQHLLSGLLRHYRLLEAEISQRLRTSLKKIPKTVVAIMALGIYEQLFTRHIPARASIYEAVQLTFPYNVSYKKALVNAVLRQLQRDLEAGYEYHQHHSLAIRTSHPDWMTARWKRHYSDPVLEQLCLANNTFDGVGVLPYSGIDAVQLQALLAQEGINSHLHPVVVNCVRVETIAALLASKVFQEGKCLIQDASSQAFMEITADLWSGNILDVCGAPGTKAFHLLNRAPQCALIVNDGSLSRLQRIVDNAKRLKSLPFPLVVSHGGFLPFKNSSFNTILLDVPCSATGTIKKNPDIKYTASVETLLKQIELQQQLLHSAAKCLVPGGFLVYSTCSLEYEENEQQIERFLKNHPDFRHIPYPQLSSFPSRYLSWITPEGYYKVLPHEETMGFFAAILRHIPG